MPLDIQPIEGQQAAPLDIQPVAPDAPAPQQNDLGYKNGIPSITVRPQGVPVQQLDIQPVEQEQKLDIQPAQQLDIQPTQELDIKPVEKSNALDVLPPYYTETEQKNRQALKDVFNQPLPDDMFQRGYVALQALGAAINYTLSPVEAMGRWAFGDPVEKVTGAKGISQDIGEAASNVALFAVDPAMIGIKGAEKFGQAGPVKAIENTLSPTTVDQGSKEAGSIIRAQSGQLAADTARASNDLQQFRSTLLKLPETDRLAFMDTIETGGKQANPKLQPIADQLRKMLDDRRAKIQGLGKGYLEKAIDNYFPHIWKDPNKAEEVARDMEREMAAGQSKRPLRGSARFLRERTVDTLAAGRARGLELVTNDPIELTLIKIREMDKFYHGTMMADELKNTGLASFVRAGGRPPVGWKQLDDNVFRARVPTEKLVDDEKAFGTVETGKWYAPEPVARVFNNYVSKGLAGQNDLFDLVRQSGNSLNMFQLGISAYHGTFTTMDSMISQVARGIENAAHGELGSAAKNISSGLLPTTAVTTAMKGSKLREAVLHPEGLTPEMQKMVEALEKGGGRVNMDSFYKANNNSLVRSLKDGSFVNQIKENFKDSPFKTVIGAPFDIATRAIQDMSHPLMGYLVPRLKLGVFYNLAEDWVKRNPNASEQEFRMAMQTAWDSVDNRLGQMVYDNLFWNKTMKDLSFLTMRSVGWNLGTVRELGGSAVDSARAVAALRTTGRMEFTHRMAYAIALPVVAGLYGSMLTYLMTGKPPQTATDYFFPQTGDETPHGYPERLSIPSYMKDVMEWNHAPFQTAENKLNPIWSNLAQIVNDRDFYGAVIYDPDDPMAQEFQQLGQYELQQLEPFSLRGMQRMQQEDASAGRQALSVFGINPAPGYITEPEYQKMWQEYDLKKARRRKVKEEDQ